MTKQGNGWKRLGFVLRKMPVNSVKLTMRMADRLLLLTHPKTLLIRRRTKMGIL
jgi:hypothetical protein